MEETTSAPKTSIPASRIGMLVLSIAMVLGASIWTYRVGLEANKWEHTNFDLAWEVDNVRKDIADLEVHKK